MYSVGLISTTHSKWTVGEFTYAYLRLARAVRRKDYLVTHADADSFHMHFPAVPLHLTLKYSDAVPVRIVVEHGMGLLPQDMTEQGFAVLAKAVMLDSMKELAIRCPRSSDCICEIRGAKAKCGLLARSEFEIEGMIANR